MKVMRRDRRYMPGTLGVTGTGWWLLLSRIAPPAGGHGTLMRWFGLRHGGHGQDHAGRGVDRLGVGQTLVDAQRAPRPERGGVADHSALPAVFVLGAVEGCREDVAEMGVLVAQLLLVRLGQGGEVTVDAG